MLGRSGRQWCGTISLLVKQCVQFCSASLGSICLMVVLSFWVIVPAQAEPQSTTTANQEVKDEGKASSQVKEKAIPRGPIPFAQQEALLRNSERWKTLTPEQRRQILAKIEHYRKRFRQRQLERQETFRSFQDAKCKRLKRKSRRLTRTDQFQRVWTRWLNLSTRRKKQVAKKWGIQSALPSQYQKELRKVWNTLSPTKRQELLRNLR